MIDSEAKFKEYISTEKRLYTEIGYKGRLHAMLTQCEVGKLYQYIYVLRKDEYYSNMEKKSIINKIKALYYRRKHNTLGLKLGISIPINTFKKGLLIYHSQGIVVHRDSRCGEFCKLHGCNCIGNNGFGGGKDNTPIVGNNLNLGFGSMLIGNIKIADNSIIAANAVVCKSILNQGETWGGVPAKLIKGKSNEI